MDCESKKIERSRVYFRIFLTKCNSFYEFNRIKRLKKTFFRRLLCIFHPYLSFAIAFTFFPFAEISRWTVKLLHEMCETGESNILL